MSERQSNRGAAWNYNHVFELSSGRFFKWQAHDDICLPTFLSRASTPSIMLPRPRFSFTLAPRSSMPVAPETIGFDQRASRRCIRRLMQRLATVLRNLNMACPVFGLIRANALSQTRLIAPFVAADYVLLAELALLGTSSREVPEVLFQRRVHPRISTYANRSAADLLRWYDPAKRASHSLHLAANGPRSGIPAFDQPPSVEPARTSAVPVDGRFPCGTNANCATLGGQYKARLKKAIGFA